MPTKRSRIIENTLATWAPTWPRRVGLHQQWANNAGEATEILRREEMKDNDGYISTYAFPRGHTSEGNVPEVDTLFIDFDIESGEYEPGSGDQLAWERDLSFLLVRARRVAEFLFDQEATGWRASLSGHKGIHLFLDFPPIPATTGDFNQFVAGVNEYARELVGHLVMETSIDDLAEYVDVTSSDLARLHRVPNTIHPGASRSFDEARFCVPITLEELADMTVERYIELTREPRVCPYSREPNEDAGDVIRHHVATANPSAYSRNLGQPSYADYQRYQNYVNEVQNEDIELEDVKFLTSDRPCVWRFHERPDKYDYGRQSHYAEMWCIRELQEKNVPVEVMKEFLGNSPDYDEDWSEDRIREIISRDYERFGVQRLIENAPEFANPESCKICRRAARDVEESELNYA